MERININIEEFIEVIKVRPILWNLKHPHYKNIKMKAKVWRQIAVQMNAKLSDCKRKWKGLRDCFIRENAKRAALDDDDNSGKWLYYNKLEFLKKHIRTRTYDGKYISDQEPPSVFIIENEFLMKNDLMDVAPISEPLKIEHPHESNSNDLTFQTACDKRSSFDMDQKLLETLSNLDSVMRTNKNDDEDEDDLFGKMVVKKLKKFPLGNRNDMKIQIMTFMSREEEELIAFPTQK